MATPREKSVQSLRVRKGFKDIEDFTRFIAWLMGEGMKGESVAKI
jgi:hypothetical protein